jgi:hypothetical protein
MVLSILYRAIREKVGMAFNVLDFNNNSYLSNDRYIEHNSPPKKKKDFFSKVGGFFEKAATEVGSKIKDLKIKEKAQVVASKGKEIIVRDKCLN